MRSMLLFALNETSLFASSLLLALIIRPFFHLSPVNCLRSQFSKGFRSTLSLSALFLSLIFTLSDISSIAIIIAQRDGVENKQISASNAFSLTLLHRPTPKYPSPCKREPGNNFAKQFRAYYRRQIKTGVDDTLEQPFITRRRFSDSGIVAAYITRRPGSNIAYYGKRAQKQTL